MGKALPARATAERPEGSPRHVLLVEDDALVSLALRLRLEAEGHRVSRAADVAHAVDDVIDARPDIVVLDVNLPDGNGLTLAARMRRLRATANIPLVVITASRDPSYRERAARLGVEAFLEKPFRAASLLDAIERATDRAH